MLQIRKIGFSLALIFIFLALLAFTYYKTRPFTLEDTKFSDYKEFYLQKQLGGNLEKMPLQEVEGNEIEGSFEYIVKYGDTFESIFSQFGFDVPDAGKVAYLLNKASKGMKIYSGQKLQIFYKTIISYQNVKEVEEEALKPAFQSKNQKNIFQGLSFMGKDVSVEISRNSKNELEIEAIPFKKFSKPKLAVGSIKTSLYQDAIDSGVSPSIVENVIRLYSFDIDFQRDIRIGDTFEIYFEEIFDEKTGKKLKDGAVIYSKITLKKGVPKSFEYYLFNNEYFDEKGRTSQKSFLKTPVPAGRLTSKFGFRRHPILGFTRLHSGLDFASPRGTPIFAAANGVIIFIGWNGTVKTGYGRHIAIKHNGTYSTTYSHLNGFRKGLTTGSKIRQGEVIGYVGSTGYSTGPHLHYEVIKNGKKINPSVATSFSVRALSVKELTKFKLEKEKIIHNVNEFKG